MALRALVATGPAPPPATMGQISGHVVDAATGNPIVGAIAQATGPTNGTANSDATGTFTLVALAPGSYTVLVAKSGFATLSQTVSVTAGVTTNLGTIRL